MNITLVPEANRKARPLVEYNAYYYDSLNNGRCPDVGTGRYLFDTNLLAHERQERTRWLNRAAKLAHTAFNELITAQFTDIADQELVNSLLLQHGRFAEDFFRWNIRDRVTRQYAESDISLEVFQQLVSLAWEYDVKFYSTSDVVFRIIDHIFEQAIIHSLNDAAFCQNLQNWLDEFNKPISCVLCGNTFKSVNLPNWIYFGANGYRYCCFQCRIIRSPKKNELLNLIPAFVRKCGFIPTSNASPINYAFTSRLAHHQWAEVITAYAEMGGVEHTKKKFGSWFKALVLTNTLPNGVLATTKGIKCLAQDGHICLSLDEQRIDNWLTDHHLLHEREPLYPSHPELNPQRRRRADWKVQDAFIEYFGLIGDEKYEKRMDEKIFLAQQLNINLIAVYPSDLTSLDQRLKILLI